MGPPHAGRGCGHVKLCTYCKLKADDRNDNPLLSFNIEDLGVIRRALLDLSAQQHAEKWAVPDRQATLQNLLQLIGNDYLLPNTRPALKNWGWITVPEILWPRVKQTPHHYSFRIVYIQIGGHKKIRYQVHTDPGNSRYM